jgi:hypothetical protein
MIREMVKKQIQENLFESFTIPNIVYRGVKGKYSDSHKQNVTWVSTSKEHAQMYADGGELVEFRLSKITPIDLGFRSAETSVKLEEVTSRLRSVLMDLMRVGKIQRIQAIKIDDDIDKLSNQSYKMVWEWVNMKDVSDLIVRMGFDAIVLREGMQSHSGNVLTFGILNKSKLTRAR